MIRLIQNDMFNITKRVKLIDADYVIFFDDLDCNYKLYALGKYCLNLGKFLDARVLDKIWQTRVENSDKIFNDIELNNISLDSKCVEHRQNVSSHMFQKIYEYASRHSNDIDYNNTFTTQWV